MRKVSILSLAMVLFIGVNGICFPRKSQVLRVAVVIRRNYYIRQVSRAAKDITRTDACRLASEVVCEKDNYAKNCGYRQYGHMSVTI